MTHFDLCADCNGLDCIDCQGEFRERKGPAPGSFFCPGCSGTTPQRRNRPCPRCGTTYQMEIPPEGHDER